MTSPKSLEFCVFQLLILCFSASVYQCFVGFFVVFADFIFIGGGRCLLYMLGYMLGEVDFFWKGEYDTISSIRNIGLE